MLISDYTLESLINTSLDLKWFDITEKMTGDAIDDYVKGFAEAFGSWTECHVVAKLVKGKQKIEIPGGNNPQTILRGTVNVHIINPYSTNGELDAVFVEL